MYSVQPYTLPSHYPHPRPQSPCVHVRHLLGPRPLDESKIQGETKSTKQPSPPFPQAIISQAHLVLTDSAAMLLRVQARTV
ncbi:predicted protein [Plenodomus lingam JN3]|uniref:Predicted protein n=1 Tax=Leptosphaeria maculans (strain JN3 / isolate v23.1.3 / race Av1-4-5-6-7-8) TaxID=985895 RepID=E4ZQ01_LEPMJ|nr:predicted protein [Plenodomus lingam JN3]CBX93536.1 predicted protein [Plenodomus lingam JN3]